MDVSKLTTGDKVIGGSAIALLIFFFFPWYDFTVKVTGGFSGTGGGRSGASYFLFGWIPLLLAIGIVVCLYLQRFTDVKLPELPITWEQLYAIAAGLAAFLILMRVLLADSRGHVSGPGYSYSANRKFGLILALLAVIGLVVGAVMNMREAPTGGDTTGGTPPQAPPVPPTA